MNYRDGGPAERAPRWWLRRLVRATAWVIGAGAIAAGCFGTIHGIKWINVHGDPKYGWCCEKHTKWCRPGDKMECVEKGGPKLDECVRFERRPDCDDTCDAWVRRDGARGENCR